MRQSQKTNKAKANINPLALIACKQRVGDDDANAIALPVLLIFDSAKRGLCNAAGCNFLTTHLIIATAIAARTKSRTFYDICREGYDALMKAAERPTKLLDLTTTEYQKIRKAIGWYLRSLPQCEVHHLNMACQHAERIMGA